MKESEVGKIPEDWDTISFDKAISNVVDNRGKTAPTSKNGIALIATNCIKENALYPTKEKIRYVSKETYENWFRDHPKPDDIIIVNKGTPGMVCLVPNPVDFVIAQDMVAVRPNKSRIYGRFLFAFMRSKIFKHEVDSLNVGTTIPHLKKTYFPLLTVPLPSKDEQTAIGDTYYNLSKKIETNLKMNETLEAIGHAVFNRWFVDFEFPNEEGKPYKSTGGKMFYDEELSMEIPKAWSVRTLDEISVNFDSKRVPLSSREREKMRGIYPYYGAVGIVDYVNQYLFDGLYVLMSEDGAYVIDENGFPTLQLVQGKFWVNNHAHILQGKGISTELLFLLLKNTNVQHIVTGAVQPKINQGNMNTLKFVIPDDACKSRLQEFVNQLYVKINVNSEQNQNLSKIRDLLLAKLVSGKIRVPVPKDNVEPD